MIHSYLRLAFRNIQRNKVYTIINVLGLSVGISCALVIFGYIYFEVNFDKHHANYDRLFRIAETVMNEDGTLVPSAQTPPRISVALQDHGIPNVEMIGRLYPASVLVSQDKESWYKEDFWIFADSTVAEMMDFVVVSGSITEALREPMNVAVTESVALKYFKGEDPVGREIHYESESASQTFNVAALIEDPPPNSHFDFSFLASFQTLYSIMPWHQSWYHPYLYTYGLLAPGGDFEAAEIQLSELIHQALPEWEKEARSYSLQKFSSIHLHSNLIREWKTNSRYEYVVIFILIAVFILLIACVNFVNLATSKAIRRSKEVGIRKVMGATRKMLIFQFLGESVAMTVISFLIAFALTEWVLLLLFNEIVDRPLSLVFLFSPEYIAYIVLGLLLVSLMSGLYPAFALSAFSPTTALRNKASGGRESSRLRKILVTFQFGISCFLIAGTLMVAKQVDFMKNTNLGFNKNYIALVKLNHREDQTNYAQYIDQLAQQSGIVHATVSSHVPGSDVLYDNPTMPENSEKEEGYNMLTLNVGHDFGKTYGLEILYGRDFSKENPADRDKAVILNESAAELFGWDPSTSVGKGIKLTWFTDSAMVKDAKVIGIVRDFHFKSLHKRIDPLIMHVNTHPYYIDLISVRFTETSIEDAVQLLTQEWDRFSPDRPVEIKFLDQELERLYQSETQAGKILTSFAGLAIFISCLGLFGLSAYAAEKRTKEIGIRKAMGASVKTIVTLLAKDFMILILIGNVIALPLVWILSLEWLSNFAYRTTPGFWIYVITIIVAVLIGFMTISFQSIKAALINPVESLKEE